MNNTATGGDLPGDSHVPDLLLEVTREFYLYTVFFTAMAGNSLTLAVIYKYTEFHTITYTIIASQSVVNVLLSLTTVVDDISDMVIHTPAGALSYCLSSAIQVVFHLMNTLFHQVLVTAERYVAILYPLRYPTIVTRSRAVRGITLCWLTSLLEALILVFWNNMGSTQSCSTDIMNTYFVIFFTLAPIVIFSVLLFYMYFHISKSARRMRKSVVDIHLNASNQNYQGENMRMSVTISFTLAAFVLCWLPTVVYLSLQVSGVNLEQVYENVAIAVAKFHGTANFIIYSFRMKKFRKRFKQIFRCSHCKHTR